MVSTIKCMLCILQHFFYKTAHKKGVNFEALFVVTYCPQIKLIAGFYSSIYFMCARVKMHAQPELVLYITKELPSSFPTRHYIHTQYNSQAV